jgi:hypothetical protein
MADDERGAERRRRPLWMTRRYWRHAPVIRWWFMYVWPDKCLSCGSRWRDHHEGCYFA